MTRNRIAEHRTPPVDRLFIAAAGMHGRGQ